MMRVPVVHPHEEGCAGAAVEFSERRIGDFPRGAFLPAVGQAVVVDVEPAGQPEPLREDEARHDGGGSVAGALELLRQDRRGIGEAARVLVDAVSCGIESRHHRRVRRERFGDRRVSLPEHASPRRDGVEGRGADAFRLGADGVGSGGVERHQEDRRSRRGARSFGRIRRAPAAAVTSRRERRQDDAGDGRSPDRRVQSHFPPHPAGQERQRPPADSASMGGRLAASLNNKQTTRGWRGYLLASCFLLLASSLPHPLHRRQELRVRLRLAHLVEEQFHRFDR